MARIAQLLQLFHEDTTRLVIGRNLVHDADAPQRAQDAKHLLDRPLWVGEVMRRTPDGDNIEDRIGKWQRLGVPGSPGDAGVEGETLGLAQHGRGEIEAHNGCGYLRQRECHEAGAGGDIERAVCCP